MSSELMMAEEESFLTLRDELRTLILEISQKRAEMIKIQDEILGMFDKLEKLSKKL